MKSEMERPEPGARAEALRHRERLVAAMPVTQHRMELAGISTAVLVGGDGPPIVLLPGPGETSLWWLRVIPSLTTSYRVLAPDLPGQGETESPAHVDAETALSWLDALVGRMCDEPPVLVGHALGGAIAARYAIRYGNRICALVLVDALGLTRFFPGPRFAFRLARFFAKPDAARYDRFLERCMYDAGKLRAGMGPDWEPFLAYYLERIQAPGTKQAVGAFMRTMGVPRIPSAELARIRVPAALIWGEHDEATPLRRAEAVARRHGWPIHVVEASGDDPKLERPQEFLAALQQVLPQIAVRATPAARRAK